ncbi:MAG: cobalamin biosynthesis protein [Desulfovibrio sp.]|nr:cobalamin biosynthesis protein [Desulfovibrio sp.]
MPFARFADALARDFRKYRGHIIVGAAGIAVRALAPLLRHKSEDAPVVVLDAAGRYAVSLLSGHWGGGNSLARHVARLLAGEPVITTASDAVSDGAPGLDELARAASLRILDWDKLPRVAAALLEGEPVPLSDPLSCLPDAREPRFRRGAEKACGNIPLVRIHWKRMPGAPEVLRMAAPLLHAGVGCRKGVDAAGIESAVRDALAEHGLEAAALASLATVTEKANEPGLVEAARRLGVPLLAYPASVLAGVPVPHPSEAAGARFDLPPFSVCEAAALLAAQEARPAGNAILLAPKTVFQGRVTVAVAVCQGEN